MRALNLRLLLKLLGGSLGILLIIWGAVLNLTGHESTQSWSLIGVGAATLGSAGAAWGRRRRPEKKL